MSNDIPQVIQNTFWKYILLYVIIGCVGVLLGIATNDSIFVMLSIGIAVFGTMKALYLLSRIRHRDYRSLVGQVLDDTKLPLRHGHVVTLLYPDGRKSREVIAGCKLLVPSTVYRIYLLDEAKLKEAETLPTFLQPAQVMLGAEQIEESIFQEEK